MSNFFQKLKRARSATMVAAKELRLTSIWLKTTDHDGRYINLRHAFDEVSATLKAPPIKTLIISTTLAATVASGIIAYKETFRSNYFNDMNSIITSNENTNDNRDFKTFMSEELKIESQKFIDAHNEAPYQKYIIRGVIGMNTISLLGVCGASVNRRRKDMEQSL